MGSTTREKIVRASLRLFVRKGIAATTTRDIAATAGIAEGTIYRHFKSKEAMAEEIYLDHYLPFADALRAAAGEATEPIEQIRAMVEHFYARFDRDPDVFIYLFIAQHTAGERIPDATPTPVSVLREVLRKAAPRRADTVLLTFIVLGMILQPAAARLRAALPGPLSRHSGAVVEAIRGALGR